MHCCPNCSDPVVPEVQKLLAIPLVEQICFSCHQGFECSARGWVSWAALVIPSILGGAEGLIAGSATYLALQIWWVTLRPTSGFTLP